MTTDEFLTAWEDIQSGLFAQVFARLRNRQESEDILQEVFIAAWKALPRYREEGNGPEHWLRVITARRVIDYYRRHRETEELDLTWRAPSEGVCVGPAWESLSRRHQVALYLRYIDGRSATQVAEALGVRETVLGSLLLRARRRFKEALFTT